jgi:Ca2+-binding EF-hand superfamily protein
MDVLCNFSLSSDELKAFSEAIGDFYANENDQRLPELFTIYNRSGRGVITRDDLKMTLDSVNRKPTSDEMLDRMMT